MKKYLLFFLYIFGLFGLFSCSFQEINSEYREHYSSIHTNHTIHTEGNLSNDLAISSDIELYTLPDASVEKVIREKIQNANERIWIELYIWTHQDIANAVVDAKNRGVDVKIILEPNVYKTPTMNLSMVSYFKKRWIDVMYSDNDRYKFTHAKFGIIDDTFFISTGNFTSSYFKNREYMIFGKSKEIHTFLTLLFDADYSHKNVSGSIKIPENIAVAPIDARQKIVSLFQKGNSHIQLYTQYLSDYGLIDELRALQKSNSDLKISICVSDTQENRETAARYQDFDWKVAKSPYLHAKIILIDSNILFLWSQNLSRNALDNNREVSMIVSERPGIVKSIEDNILEHCKDIEDK